MDSRLILRSYRVTIPEDLAIGCPRLDCYPSFYLLFWFCGESCQFPGAWSSLRAWAGRRCFQRLPRASFLVLPRYLVNLLDSMKSMNPAEAMSRRSSCWNSMIVQGLPKERSSQSCKGFSSHLWSGVAFDHWPTHKCNRALRRPYLMTGRQECLRAIVQSRRDEDRARALVLPRSSAFHHWPLPPLWGFWTPEWFQFRSVQIFSAQHVHRRPEVDHEFPLFWLLRRWCQHYPVFDRKSRTYLLTPFLSLQTSFARSLASLRRVAPLLGFRLAFFPRILEPTEFAPEVHISAWLPAIDPFIPKILRDASWSCTTWQCDSIRFFLQNRLLLRANLVEWSLSKRPLFLFFASLLWLLTGMSTSLSVSDMILASRLRLVNMHTGGCHKSNDGPVHFPLCHSSHALLLFNTEGLVPLGLPFL